MTPADLFNARKELKLTQAQMGGKLGLTCERIVKMEASSQRLDRRTELAVLYLLNKEKPSQFHHTRKK